MKFEWEPQKAESTRRKHDVSFEEAITVFKDTLAFIFDDEEHSQSGPQKIIGAMTESSIFWNDIIFLCNNKLSEKTTCQS